MFYSQGRNNTGNIFLALLHTPLTSLLGTCQTSNTGKGMVHTTLSILSQSQERAFSCV